MTNDTGHKIRPYLSRLALVFALSDAAVTVAALWVATELGECRWHEYYTVAAAASVGLYSLFAESNNLYRSWRGATFREEASRIVAAWVGVAVSLTVLAFVTKTSVLFSRRCVILWFVLAPVFIGLWRLAIRSILREIRRRGYNLRRVAIAGAGQLGARLAATIHSSPWMGMQIVAFYDDMKPVGYRPNGPEGPAVAGTLDDLVEEARRKAVDLAYIALPLRAEARVKELISGFADTSAALYLVPDLFVFDLLCARSVNIGGIQAISVFERPFYGVDGMVKRIEDVVLGSLLLLVFALPMLAIALGVKLTSPGPVLFKQRRYGLDGREIEVWKFRSMTVCEDGPVVAQATRCDPRVTRLGGFLRRTSLDELPQFINVLQGRMSLVGPRPHAVAHNEAYRKIIRGYMLRHRVKPGITGWAQINGWRGETDTLEKMEKRVEHDLWYIRNWSLWLDLKILLATAFKGFRSENAY